MHHGNSIMIINNRIKCNLMATIYSEPVAKCYMLPGSKVVIILL